jgi:hypothetical protein
MGDSTSSYATTSIGLRIIWPRKPHHYVKVGLPTGGEVISGTLNVERISTQIISSSQIMMMMITAIIIRLTMTVCL